MKHWLIVIIICVAFVGGYALSFGVKYYQSNKIISLEENTLGDLEENKKPYSTLAFKLNLFNHNQEQIGVCYIPMYKIEEIQSLKNIEKYSSIIPTVDAEIFTNLPIDDEYSKYFSYCLDLIPWKKDRDQAKFIP